MDEKYKGIEKYGKYYSDSSLKQKVLKVAKKSGQQGHQSRAVALLCTKIQEGIFCRQG